MDEKNNTIPVEFYQCEIIHKKSSVRSYVHHQISVLFSTSKPGMNNPYYDMLCDLSQPTCTLRIMISHGLVFIRLLYNDSFFTGTPILDGQILVWAFIRGYKDRNKDQ